MRGNMNNEDWYASDTNWIDSNISNEDWYGSYSYESIQSKSGSFMIRFTGIWIDSGKEEVKNWCCQHLNRFKKTVNRFTVNGFKKTVNRFIVILFRKTVNRFTMILFRKTVNRFTVMLFMKIWLDKKGVTQGKWLEGMLDMNQWIMTRIKQFTKGLSYTWRHTRHQRVTWHNETWFARCFNKFLS